MPLLLFNRFHLAHDYTIDLVAALNVQGLEVEHYRPEFAPRGARTTGPAHGPAGCRSPRDIRCRGPRPFAGDLDIAVTGLGPAPPLMGITARLGHMSL